MRYPCKPQLLNQVYADAGAYLKSSIHPLLALMEAQVCEPT